YAGADPVGVWRGECENGRASGVGVGVAQLSGGPAVEYFGEALDGRPDGAGYLIEHANRGSSAFEGSFVDGLRDGVLRVSRAGRRNELRLYRDGRDAGPAPSGAIVASPFDLRRPPAQAATPSSGASS
ncbi:MAG: hypothetical protein AAFQ67_08360, partial [Pseudomonadota bacterium]